MESICPKTISPEASNKEQSFKDKIAQIESNGNYAAVGDNGHAFGKYQFHLDTASNVLGRKVTGKELLASPDLQEELMDTYMKDELLPQSVSLHKLHPNMNAESIMALIHNQGLPTANKILSGQEKPDKITPGYRKLIGV